MTTSRNRAPRWWAFPVTLCALVTVGCSSVGGAATGDGPTPSTPSAISTPGVVDPPQTSDTPPPHEVTSSGTDVDPGDSEPSISEPSVSEPDVPGSTSDDPSTAPPQSTSTGAGTSTGPASTPTDASGGPTGPVLTLDRFQSPSGNISCLIDGGASVRCDLRDTAITEKHDCQGIGDWGHSVSLTRGRPASMQCVSDTVLNPQFPVLAYGSSTQVGSITCSSRKDGVRCGDREGHGFWLSRSAYAVS